MHLVTYRGVFQGAELRNGTENTGFYLSGDRLVHCEFSLHERSGHIASRYRTPVSSQLRSVLAEK